MKGISLMPLRNSLALAFALAIGSAGAVFGSTAAEMERDAPAGAARPLTSLPPHQTLISAFYKAKVYDEANYRIGEVKDMLVDRNGKINAVLLSVGVFLGVAEKDIAVPLDSIKVNRRDGRSWLSLNLAKQALRSAPAYVFDSRTAEWEPRLARD